MYQQFVWLTRVVFFCVCICVCMCLCDWRNSHTAYQKCLMWRHFLDRSISGTQCGTMHSMLHAFIVFFIPTPITWDACSVAICSCLHWPGGTYKVSALSRSSVRECMCVCMCVTDRERETERQSDRTSPLHSSVAVRLNSTYPDGVEISVVMGHHATPHSHRCNPLTTLVPATDACGTLRTVSISIIFP